MNIVLEGHDNSGKSTLAALLSKRLHMEVHSSEGPEKYPGELEERVSRYSQLNNVIFDRHPCISDPIYSIARGKPSNLRSSTIIDFYESKPLLIYCDPLTRGLGSHIKKAHDTDEHMAIVESNYKSILHHYRTWAVEHAHINYRVGEDSYSVVRFCRAKIGAVSTDMLSDVQDFLDKFSQSYDGPPRALPLDLGQFREDFMEEELGEYKKHARHLNMLFSEAPDSAEITHQLAEQLDALIDKVYIDLGTALLHGFNFREGWRRVHIANMQKERVAKAFQSARHSLYDVVKPPGWQAPSHVDLVENHIHKKP